MSTDLQIQIDAREITDSTILEEFIRTKTNAGNAQILIRKKSLDARSQYPFYIVQYTVFANKENINAPNGFEHTNVKNAPEVHIIGCGPGGLFAALQCIELGLKPIVIERGKNVKNRRRDLAVLNKEGVVNPESNYCFGEGGAGTYSDGKLYTRSKKRGPIDKVLQELIVHGANPNIAYEAHPHIGTNKLPQIIENISQLIIDCGGEIWFNKKLTNFHCNSSSITSIELNYNETTTVNAVILATGHSARDIFEMLHNNKIQIEAKPFALGVRIEHPQELINKMQYRNCEASPNLPPASYNLVEQVINKGVFSFCMCPGGIIAPAATNANEVVVNGWSPSKRNGKFANSGFVVGLEESDFVPFQKYGELRALHFQMEYEKIAYNSTGSIKAPAQRMMDFINNKNSKTLPDCSYFPGIVSTDIRTVLPESIHQRIKKALEIIGAKKKQYLSNEAVLVGVESRTSSPVRIPRDFEKLQHPQITNLYPCAEGAGYAGGIMSAALDGMRVAEKIKENKNLWK